MREQKKLTNRQADALEFIKNFVNKTVIHPLFVKSRWG